MLKRIRFIFLSIVGAVAAAALGAFFLHLAVHAWQIGELHGRSGLVMTSETHPIGFVLGIILGIIVGVSLLLGSPFVLSKILSSRKIQEEFAAKIPYLFGKTRPSIFYSFVAIVLLVAIALLRR
jgi:hypothetical protein